MTGHKVYVHTDVDVGRCITYVLLLVRKYVRTYVVCSRYHLD